MTTQILSLQKKHDVLLMFDADDLLTTKAMSEFATKCGLHDLHSQVPAKTTCNSSSKGHIDYIIGTTAVEAAVIQNGTLSYAEGLISDHRGLFVDIDHVALLQLDTVNQVMPIAGRLLRSGNPEVHNKYIDKVTDYFEKHNMFERLDRIIKSGRRYSKPCLRPAQQTRCGYGTRHAGRRTKSTTAKPEVSILTNAQKIWTPSTVLENAIQGPFSRTDKRTNLPDH
jgi:predicted Zn-ribbon and HTH transcriptional regulator